jgi:hypothetical protein
MPDRPRVEPELQTRGAEIPVLAIRANPAGFELEQAHAPELNAAAGAAGDRVRDDVPERPLRRDPRRRLDDHVHAPEIVPALAEHAFEHRAQLLRAPVLAVEVVGVARRRREAADEARDVLPVECRREIVNDAHRCPPEPPML